MNPSDHTISKFIWRSGVIFSIFLLGLSGALAAFGRIEYRYHLGVQKVSVVIQREAEPLRFWSVAGSLIAASVAAIVFTGIGAARLHSEEKKEPNQALEPTAAAGRGSS